MSAILLFLGPILVLFPSPALTTLKNGAEVWERMLPPERVKERFTEIRKILLPVPEEQLEEGLYHIGSYYIPIDAETELCRNHSNFYFESFLNKDLWALRMVDSSSKVPAGLLDGHIIDLGSYDECMTVEAPGGMFQGQFCVVETKGVLPDEIYPAPNPDTQFVETFTYDFAFAVCVPSSCTPRDVKAHMDVALNSINATAIVYPQSCSSAMPDPYTKGDIITIFLIILLAVFTILSTIYDYNCKESERNGLLAAWSLGANVSQMVDTSTTKAAITCLNGLRVITMFWVIIGHRTLQVLNFPSLRLRYIPEKIDLLAMAYIENTQVAVEIFFLMSGVLVAYGYLRYQNKGRKFNVIHFYLYRYLRLTPVLAAVVLLQATILVRFTDGPLWRRMFNSYQQNCQDYWWSTLLYVANYANPYKMCVPQGWYLCSDFQLYVLCPLVLIPLSRRPRLALTLVAGLAALTTAAALVNAYTEELKAGGAVTMDRRTEIVTIKDYIVTHFRAFSFLLGLALGYLLFLVKEGQLIIKLSRWMLWVGWIVSITFILFSILFVNYFLSPSYEYDPVVDTLYLIFHRHLLSLGCSWVILICTLGHGGFVDKFLSWRAWIPMARLTYCAYLTHVFVQTSETNSQRGVNSLHHIYVLYYHFAADMVISYLSAAVLYLTVEAPAANLTTWFFQGKKKSEDVEETPNINNIPPLPIFKYSSPS